MSASMDLNEREHLRALTHTDPTENVARQLGQEVTHAKGILSDLERSLARLDDVKEKLLEHGIDIDVDLGEVGNAAQNARRQVAKVPRRTFSFPA